MKILILMVSLLFVSSCSTFSTEKMYAEGAKASAFCVEGSGPPLSGQGKIMGGKIDKDFKGQVLIDGDCSILISSE